MSVSFEHIAYRPYLTSPIGFKESRANLASESQRELYLSDFQKWRYEETYMLLQHILKSTNCLNKDKITSVCDFGAGSGGPTQAIKKFFNLDDEHITAIENDFLEGKEIHESEILPKSSVIIDNGINVLTRGEKKYDLITACYFGPDYWGGEYDELFKSFISAAGHSLNPEGKVLVFSDPMTMKTVKRVCNNNRLTYEVIPKSGLFNSPRGLNQYGLDPESVIISLDEPVSIK